MYYDVTICRCGVHDATRRAPIASALRAGLDHDFRVQRECTLEGAPTGLRDFEQEGTLGKLVIITR